MIGIPILRLELSSREREVAELVGDGESYKQIAASLKITVSSVQVYVARMDKKIDIERDKALPPRLRVFAYVMWERWSKQRATAL